MNNTNLARELCKSLEGNEWKSVANLLDTGYKGIYVALRILRDSSMGISSGDLARRMGISTARVATLLRTLVKKNYAERIPSGSDGRKIIINITSCGLKALEQREQEVYRTIDTFLQRLSDNEAKTLLDITKKLSKES